MRKFEWLLLSAILICGIMRPAHGKGYCGADSCLIGVGYFEAEHSKFIAEFGSMSKRSVKNVVIFSPSPNKNLSLFISDVLYQHDWNIQGKGKGHRFRPDKSGPFFRRCIWLPHAIQIRIGEIGWRRAGEEFPANPAAHVFGASWPAIFPFWHHAHDVTEKMHLKRVKENERSFGFEICLYRRFIGFWSSANFDGPLPLQDNVLVELKCSEEQETNNTKKSTPYGDQFVSSIPSADCDCSQKDSPNDGEPNIEKVHLPTRHDSAWLMFCGFLAGIASGLFIGFAVGFRSVIRL